jgi:ribosomal protein L16 Arg81 hydroxylase
MISTLSDVLSPTGMQQFLDAYATGQPLNIKGWPDKFAGLLSWAEVNEILMRHQFDFPRMRLLREGKILAAETYLRQVTSRRQSGAFRTKLAVDLFSEQLRAGATLVIDDVHEMCAQIMDLCSHIEQTLRERVQVNAYVAWASARALDLHWDDHDVLAIQLLGKKSWAVYPMTRRRPLTFESLIPPDPSDKPAWEGELQAGDLLYVPRGWWHQVLPLGEPAIHLTFGIYRRTGLDLIVWLGEKLRSEEIFRQDLPRFASREGQAQHLDRLRLEFLARWDQDLLERFLRETDGMAEPTSVVGLPWSLLSSVVELPEDLKLRLTAARPIITTVDPQKNTLSFAANGKRWEFASAAGPILQELDHHASRSVRELCELTSNDLSADSVREFLLQLLHEGLLAAERDDASTLQPTTQRSV